MKGDRLFHKNKNSVGHIARIRIAYNNKITTVIFFDASREYVNLNDYTYDKEKKVWKITRQPLLDMLYYKHNKQRGKNNDIIFRNNDAGLCILLDMA